MDALVPSRMHTVEYVECGKTITRTLMDIQFPLEILDRVGIFVNRRLIRDINHFILNKGDKLEILVYPAGGGDNSNKNAIIATVAVIAVALIAPHIATGILTQGASWAAAAPAGVNALAHAGIRLGITLVAQLLASALVPPPSATTSGYSSGSQSVGVSESPAYSFTGQSNTTRPYQTVPKIYGRMKFVPPLAATPQIENVGKTSEVRALYDFGLGDVDVTSIRVGDTDIEFIDPRIYLHRNSLCNDLQIMSASTSYDQYSFVLQKDEPVELTTDFDANSAILDITFPEGLVRYHYNNDRKLNSVEFRVEYSLAGADDWTTVPATAYHGARVNVENLTYTAYYDRGENPDEGYYYSAWAIYTRMKDDDREILYKARLNGDMKFSVRSDNNGLKRNQQVAGGVTYRRGTARDSTSWDDGVRSYVFHELLVGEPASDDTVIVSNNTSVPFTLSVNINFPTPGRYDIRVTRFTSVSDSAEQNTLRDRATVTLLRSLRQGPLLMLRDKNKHTMLEVSYIATDQLNGVIQNLTAETESVLKDFDENGWILDDNSVPVTSGTSNNARICVDLLTAEYAKYPVSDDQIDWPAWYALKVRCDEKIRYNYNGYQGISSRYEWNGVIDTDMTLGQALEAVLSTCRAMLGKNEQGQYTVIMDEENDTPRQLLTPSNSWGFSGTRTFAEIPDGFRVTFQDENQDWDEAQVMVWRDGKSFDNHETVEDLATFGITSYAQAYRYGFYMMAQGILRSEVFSMSMDIENLAVHRGDLVQVQHDVPLFGGQSFIVQEVLTGDVIRLDQQVELPNGYFTVRSMDGIIYSGTVLGQASTDTVVVDDSTHIEAGCLIVLGLSDPPVVNYLVKGVEAGEDFTAQLSLVKYDSRVYDEQVLPDWDPNFGKDLSQFTILELEWVGYEQTWEYPENVPTTRVAVYFAPTQESAQVYSGAHVYARIANQAWQLMATLLEGETQAEFTVVYNNQEWFENDIIIRIVGFNALGVKSPALEHVITLNEFNLRPNPPTDFFLDVRSEELHMIWTPSSSRAISKYLIRYTPDLVNPRWNKAQQLGKVSNTTTEFSVGARTGTYMIRAMNIAGLVSTVVKARTTVADLVNLSTVQTLTKDPDWLGTLENFTRGKDDAFDVMLIQKLSEDLVEVFAPVEWSNDLLLVVDNDDLGLDAGEYYEVSTTISIPSEYLVSTVNWRRNTTAVYSFNETIDLGAVYETRIGSKVDFGAFTPEDATTNGLLTLENAFADLEQASDDLWSAWLEYRAISEFSVIAEWATMAEIDPIAYGAGDWNEWRPITVGNITGRFIEFRLVAKAFQQGIYILVYNCEVEIYFQLRSEKRNNIVVPVGGTEVYNFDPAFADKPVVAVTIEGSTTAVRARTDVTEIGFSVELFNQNDVSVAGQVDIVATGYGKEREESI